MTPTIYGYARLLPCTDAATELARVRRKLGGFAGGRGFMLMDVFAIERPGQRLAVWRELLANCEQFGVRDIVVPSLAHLNECESLARWMCADVARFIGGRVWIVGESAPAGGTAQRVEVMAR